jgi:hypothetical protein
MSRQLSAPPDDDITQALASDRLGVPAVLFFVMSAAAPFTVIAGTLPNAYAVTGNLGLPASFIVVGVVLALFSVGYVAMSRHLPHAGAFYAYISHAWGALSASERLGRPFSPTTSSRSVCMESSVRPLLPREGLGRG